MSDLPGNAAEGAGLPAPDLHHKQEAARLDYGADAGAGYDDSEGLKLSYLKLLQHNSNEIRDGLAGATPGRILDPGSGMMWDASPGVPIIIVRYVSYVAEWTPGMKDRKLIARHAPGSPAVAAAQRMQTADGFSRLLSPEGNEMRETVFGVGLLLTEDGACARGPVAVTLTGWKLPGYRAWKTRTRAFAHIPAYALRFRLGAYLERRSGAWAYRFVPWDGQDVAAGILPPSAPLAQQARALFMSVRNTGAASTTRPHEEEAPDDIPF